MSYKLLHTYCVAVLYSSRAKKNKFVRRLEKEGHVSLKELFIDGTKIEANANRYTFVWRRSINYYLAGL